MINRDLIPNVRVVLIQQPIDSQQQAFIKFQITSNNHSYNELNSRYETKTMEHQESIHSSLFFLNPLVGLWQFETFNSYP